jgi:hypothetical protein
MDGVHRRRDSASRGEQRSADAGRQSVNGYLPTRDAMITHRGRNPISVRYVSIKGA